jgi:hypothetical protein
MNRRWASEPIQFSGPDVDVAEWLTMSAELSQTSPSRRGTPGRLFSAHHTTGKQHLLIREWR